MDKKPRISLVLLRAGWLTSASPDVLAALAEDVERISACLKLIFEIPRVWLVDSPEALQECLAGLQDPDLDLAILAFQTRAEERLLVDLLDGMGQLPLVVWCYLPWRRLPRPVSPTEMLRGSGPSGTLAALGMLRERATHFFFVHGAPEDPRLVNDLVMAARAGCAYRLLRKSRIGLLAPNAGRVDAENFTHQIGARLVGISPAEYADSVQAEAAAGLDLCVAKLAECTPEADVSKEVLGLAAASALGLAGLAEVHHLDALAVDTAAPEVHDAAGIYPGMYPTLLRPSDALFQPWPDPCAAAAGLVLAALSDSVVFSLHVWFWDEARNQVIVGHPGLQDPRVAGAGQFCISPDLELEPAVGGHGIHLHFIARPGRVTLFQLRSSAGGFQATAATGICLDSLPWVEACPHAVLRLDPLLGHFLQSLAISGASPNWVMAYGSYLPELEAMCQIAGIPLDVIA